jgi:hypothetical protein
MAIEFYLDGPANETRGMGNEKVACINDASCINDVL